jgi:Ca2+-binding RTX toxin-like protein
MRGVIRKSLAVAAGLLFLVPASALAGTASVEDGIARYDAKFGETNSVIVLELPGTNTSNKTVRFIDDMTIDLEGGCNHPTASERIADCVVPETSSRVRANLGNRDDRIETSTTRPLTTMGFSVEGALGADTLLGTAQHDALDGEGGNDVIRGRAGDDGLVGGNGEDDIKGEGGDDTLNADDNSAGDLLDCGSGPADSAVFDLGDTVSISCETQTQN